MKNLANLAGVLAFIVFSACGGGAGHENNDAENDGAEEIERMNAEMDNNAVAEEDEDEGNEKEIDLASLPQAVKDAVMAKYADASIEEAEEITNDDGTISYEVEIKNNEGEMELIFSSEGAFLGMDQEEGDDDGEMEDDDMDESSEEMNDM